MPPILSLLEPDPETTGSTTKAIATTIHIGLGQRTAFPQDLTVLDLFRERVVEAPDRPALRYRNVTMSYAELDSAANATATWLIAHGVPPRSLIPVLVTDGPEFPIALLAVLKSGAAFVPLDPAWPTDRLKRIAAELDPPAILTTSASVEVAADMGLSSAL